MTKRLIILLLVIIGIIFLWQYKGYKPDEGIVDAPGLELAVKGLNDDFMSVRVDVHPDVFAKDQDEGGNELVIHVHSLEKYYGAERRQLIYEIRSTAYNYIKTPKQDWRIEVYLSEDK